MFAVVAALTSAVGALVQGQQDSADLKQQAQIEGYHAQIADQQARQAGQRASAAEEAQRREARQVLGGQRAAIAQSGTSFSGSNMDIMRQSTTAAELDALNIQYAGNVERGNFLEEGKMRRYNQSALKDKAKATRRMSWFNALGSGMQAYGGAGGKTFFGEKPGKG